MAPRPTPMSPRRRASVIMGFKVTVWLAAAVVLLRSNVLQYVLGGSMHRQSGAGSALRGSSLRMSAMKPGTEERGLLMDFPTEQRQQQQRSSEKATKEEETSGPTMG